MRLVLFNLIPYREGRDRKQRLFFKVKVLAGALSVALICMAVHSEFERRIQLQQNNLERVRAVSQDIAQRVAKADQVKSELSELKLKVNTLQSLEERSQWAGRILALLDATKPRDVMLQSIEVKQDSIRLLGFTAAVPLFGTWVKVLETEANLLRGADLKVVKAKTQDKAQGKEGGVQMPAAYHEFDVQLRAAGLADPPSLSAGPHKEVSRVVNQ